jgi:hypothetical protein
MATNTITTSIEEAKLAVTGWAEKLRADNTRFALLSVPTGQSAATFNSSNGEVTVAAAQTWQTGDRLRIVNTNPFGAPSLSPLAVSTDYWAIRVSGTVFKLASSKANAISGTALSVPEITSSSYYALAAAAPTYLWPVADLVGYEISHPAYTNRYSVPISLPNPTVSSNVATLNFELATISHSDGTALAYNAIALIKGGSTTIGNTTGTVLNAGRLTTAISIAGGEAPRLIQYGYSVEAG